MSSDYFTLRRTDTALYNRRLNLVDALKQGGRSGASGPRSQRMRNFLVVTEMAMSLMLLVGASLLVQSILSLERQTLGIRQGHLLKDHFYLPGVRYPDPGALTRFPWEITPAKFLTDKSHGEVLRRIH